MQVRACTLLAYGASSAQCFCLPPTPSYLVIPNSAEGRELGSTEWKSRSCGTSAKDFGGCNGIEIAVGSCLALSLTAGTLVKSLTNSACFPVKVIFHIVECHLSYFQISKWMDLETNECMKESRAVNFWRLVYNSLSVISICLPRYFCELYLWSKAS